MFERFAESARRVVVLSHAAASERGDRAIDVGHLLVSAGRENAAIKDALEGCGVTEDVVGAGMSEEADRSVLASIGVDLDSIVQSAEATFGPGALDRTKKTGRKRRRKSLSFTDHAESCLEDSLRVALERKDKFICDAHIAIAALSATQPMQAYLRAQGCDLDALEVKLETLIVDKP